MHHVSMAPTVVLPRSDHFFVKFITVNASEQWSLENSNWICGTSNIFLSRQTLQYLNVEMIKREEILFKLTWAIIKIKIKVRIKLAQWSSGLELSSSSRPISFSGEVIKGLLRAKKEVRIFGFGISVRPELGNKTLKTSSNNSRALLEHIFANSFDLMNYSFFLS